MLKLPNINIVALVGMSGAGKSTVCKRFADSGYSVIDCDIIAREVAEDKAFLREVSDKITPALINADGSLCRPKTAELIFNDNKMRKKYNNIIYPYITYKVIERVKQSECDIMLDAPTLFEARLDSICTHIVSVCADADVCIDRIVKRDNITRELASARLSSQHDMSFYRSRSDYCIINNASEEQLYEQADKVIYSLKGD